MWVGSSSFHKRKIDVSVSFFSGSLFITTGVAPSHFIFSCPSRAFLIGCKWPTMHLATIQICDSGMMAIETAKRIGSDQMLAKPIVNAFLNISPGRFNAFVLSYTVGLLIVSDCSFKYPLVSIVWYLVAYIDSDRLRCVRVERPKYSMALLYVKDITGFN